MVSNGVKVSVVFKFCKKYIIRNRLGLANDFIYFTPVIISLIMLQRNNTPKWKTQMRVSIGQIQVGPSRLIPFALFVSFWVNVKWFP